MLVGDEDATFARIVGGVCGKIKQQPLIDAVNRSLEQQMYCKYLNNTQRGVQWYGVDLLK